MGGYAIKMCVNGHNSASEYVYASEAMLLFVWYSQVWSIMEMATLGHPLGPHLHPSHRKAYQCAFSCLTLLI